MDPDAALDLVRSGSTLLLLDVPRYTLVGIDTQVVSVGPSFKGIKMIPPGLHFVFYSSANREGKEFSPTIGFFISSSLSEVVVRKWSQEEERLIKLSEEEEESYCQATKSLEFDRFLGPYALSTYREWKQLSNYITKSTIERIEPIGGEISVVFESRMLESIPKTTMEKALDEQLRNSKLVKPDDKSQRGGCYYTPIPRFLKRKGVPGQELTSLNLDKTELLEDILMKYHGGSENMMLGELQFAFIAFMMGQSLEAFLQWKSITTLFFSCTKSPLCTRSQLFTKFLKVIYYQLKYGLQKESPDAQRGTLTLDDSWLTDNSFLHHLCKDFFAVMHEASAIDGDLLLWSRKLEALLHDTLGWEFQKTSAMDELRYEDDDEFAPVVVEMPEDQAMTA